MARKRKKNWSYSAGRRGVNRVRAFQRTDGRFFLEWHENGRRCTVLLQDVTDPDDAAARAEKLATSFAELAARRSEPITLARLIDLYIEEVTPQKGSESIRRYDRRTARIWKAFFNVQTEASRRSDRLPSTLDRTDWDRFIAARRSGRIPGATGPVRDRQVQYDLAFMLKVLNWATGAGEGGKPYLDRQPWSREIRKAQKWEMPKEQSPQRPAMTDQMRSDLIQHAPGWQFGLALVLCRAHGRRLNAVRQLLWSDVDLEAGMIRWRGELDKAGREQVTPLMPEAVEALRQAPRGIGNAPVFPSKSDPAKPTSRMTFNIWMQRAKRRLLRATPEEQRPALAAKLHRLGYHAEKRAAVRDARFRALPIKVQEAMTGTNYSTLKQVYDDVTPEDIRQAWQAVSGSK